jgi:hypothetical protein
MDILFNISMEFELHGVKFKYEDGEMYRWYEYARKGNLWKKIKYNCRSDGYIQIQFMVNGKPIRFKLHRIVYWLHNPKWDIFDSSQDNTIDHINGIRDDNRIENLRNITNQQNQWNRVDAKGFSWNKKKKKMDY